MKVQWQRLGHAGLTSAFASMALAGVQDSRLPALLIAYYPSQRKELLYRAGRLLGELPSAFSAEMLALELGLQTLSILLDT